MELKVKKRDLKIKPKNIRRDGNIPAVFYGKEEKSTAITIKLSDFIKVYKETGKSSIINLNVDGDIKEVVVKKVDYHPVKDTVNHVDFYVLLRGQEMEAEIPFEFIGTPKAINFGNVINYILTSVSVKTLPKNLPENIKISVENLENVGDHVSLRDIKLPEGVSFETEDLTEIVVTVSSPKTADEEEETNSEELKVETQKSEEIKEN